MKQYKTPFYKTDFYITGAEARKSHTDPIKHKFTKVSGWGLTLEAPNGDIIEIGLDRRPTRWKVTERTTGLAPLSSDYSTREEALRAITPDFLQNLADCLKNPAIIDVANKLNNHILKGGSK